jgi:predicted cupin superfamily sugar epimerase
MTADQIKSLLGLVPLPHEGGFYAETYRSGAIIPGGTLGREWPDARSVATAIYYLLTPETFSALHRVRSDEMFHFYLGDPVEMLLLSPDGSTGTLVLGSDLAAGMRPQVLVPHGAWQGARLAPGGRLALLGTTVAPGFDFADFELGEREALILAYPGQRDRIFALTRQPLAQ